MTSAAIPTHSVINPGASLPLAAASLSFVEANLLAAQISSPRTRRNLSTLQGNLEVASLRPLMPRVIAHRGARQIAPENTIAAIHAAKKLGMTFCEVDVMLSKDGIAFIHHDKELHRCSNGTGYFASKTAQELQTLDAGKWFSPEFEGERIPLLEDLIKACKDDNLGLNIEVKHLRVNADDIPTEEETVAERAVATETCRIIQSLEDKDRICFSSFSVAALEICQVMCPSIPRSLLVEAIPSNWQSEVTRLGAVSLNFNHKKCTQQQVEEIQKTGTPMYCYTVNEGPRAVELLQWGVSGVFSDCPDVIEASILASNLPPVPPCA